MLKGELILPMLRRPSSLSSLNIFKHEYLRGQQVDCNQIYLKRHWGGGKAAWSFGADQSGTLVSMTTYSSHRVIMGKNGVITFSRSNVFDRILFILAGNDDMHYSLVEFEIWSDSTTDYGVSCP